jgi:integrase
MPKKNETKTRFTKTFSFDGKRFYCTGKTEAEAIVLVAIRKKELQEGKRRITKNMLCCAWVKEYMKIYREPVIEYKSYKDELSLWDVHIAPEIGSLMLVQIKSLHCQSVLNKMAAKGRRTKQVIKARIFMKSLFREAIANDLLVNNPADQLKMPTCTEDGTNRNITQAERKVLLAACEKRPHPHGLWVKLMLYCGCRPDETSRIHGRHIDIQNKRLFIDGTKTKAAKRWVPIPDVFLPELVPYAKNKFEPILNNGYGRPLNVTNRKRMWEQMRKEMHILLGGKTDYGEIRRVLPPYAVAKDFKPYSLRHTFCTDLAKAGIPLVTAAKFMGHTTITMVSRIYTHVDEELFQDAHDKINKYYASIGSDKPDETLPVLRDVEIRV